MSAKKLSPNRVWQIMSGATKSKILVGVLD